MQFGYGFRCTFYEEFVSFIVFFIFSLYTIIRISVKEFKNVGCGLGNCQWPNPAELHKVTTHWPMARHEWKPASALIFGSETHSK